MGWEQEELDWGLGSEVLDGVTWRLLTACSLLFIATPLLSLAGSPQAAYIGLTGTFFLGFTIAINIPRLLRTPTQPPVSNTLQTPKTRPLLEGREF